MMAQLCYFHTRRLSLYHLEKRLFQTSLLSERPNYDFIPTYAKNEPIRDEPRAGVVESKEDFKYVERLIPSMQIPKVPKHQQYPTPSGWSPPTGVTTGTPYNVVRTRYQGVPVYIHTVSSSQHWTLIKNIRGDIWTLADDLKYYLEKEVGKAIPLTVNEYAMKIKYKGLYEELVKQWLVDKGF